MKATHIQDGRHKPSKCQPLKFQGDSHHENHLTNWNTQQ